MPVLKFTSKDDDREFALTPDEVEEVIPDSDMRFSLLILKNGEKHFVRGLAAEIRADLDQTV